MELMQKNKKVERLINSTVLQLPIETDINISDSKPDASQIIFDKATARLDEIKAGTNKVWVKGKIAYQILYSTEKDKRDMAGMHGEIPFSEEVYLDGVEVQDVVMCNARLEQYHIKIINSRKWNFQAKVMLQLRVQETVEESFCIGVDVSQEKAFSNPKLEFQTKNMEYLENIVSKKDLLRIHEEVNIPNTYGSADQIDWKSAYIKNITFQTFQEKIVAHGELQAFICYTEDGDEIRNYYDVTIPFSQTLICQECQDNVLSDIAYSVNHEEITVRENEDGENRVIFVELVLELEMKLWKKEVAQIVSGVYGINCQTQVSLEQVPFVTLYKTDSFEESMMQAVTLEQAATRVIHDMVSIDVDQCEIHENEITIRGSVKHSTFLQKQAEDGGFGQNKITIPFTSTYQLQGAGSTMVCKAIPVITDNQSVLREDNELEYTTTATFYLMVLKAVQEETVKEMTIAPINQEEYDALPGIMVHVIQKGDSLWKLGKEYYMSIDMIKEMNGITEDELVPGEKLILMKMA